MKSTVVGSFPVEIKEASSPKNKLLNALGAYDPFKESIKDSVIAQLEELTLFPTVRLEVIWFLFLQDIFLE